MACGGNCACGDKAGKTKPTLHAGVALAPEVSDTPPPKPDFPSPIPWLGQVGEIRAIDVDRVSPGADVLSKRPEAIADAANVQREMAKRTAARASAMASELGLGTPREVGLASATTAGAPPSVLGKPAKPAKIDPSRPGSGIPARLAIRVLVWVRRVAQAGFLALFLYLLFQTTFRGSFTAKAGEAVRLSLPVEGFLLADPFVAAMTLLSTHTVYRGLLWSVGLLGVTLVFGRVSTTSQA